MITIKFKSCRESAKLQLDQLSTYEFIIKIQESLFVLLEKAFLIQKKNKP